MKTCQSSLWIVAIICSFIAMTACSSGGSDNNSGDNNQIDGDSVDAPEDNSDQDSEIPGDVDTESAEYSDSENIGESDIEIPDTDDSDGDLEKVEDGDVEEIESDAETSDTEDESGVLTWDFTYNIATGTPQTVEVTDEDSPLYGFKIVFKGDELDPSQGSYVVISIKELRPRATPEGSVHIGPAVRLDAQGRTFAHPVLLYLPVSSAEIIANSEEQTRIIAYRSPAPNATPVQLGGPAYINVLDDDSLELETVNTTHGITAIVKNPRESAFDYLIAVRTPGFSEYEAPVVAYYPACEDDYDCYDGRYCTIDDCMDSSCQWHLMPEGSNCNDGNQYTVNDKCTAEGRCRGTRIECFLDSECETLKYKCLKARCTNNMCEWAGEWFYAGLACDDGDVCTVNDICDGGINCAGTQKNCNDTNECTTDYCEFDGLCYNDAVLGEPVCNDQNPATSDDRCRNGRCQGVLPQCENNPDCNDQRECTTDLCLNNKCKYIPLTGPECDDNDPLSSPDLCRMGYCIGDWDECKDASDCNDENECTTDKCITGACFQSPMSSGSCNDGDPDTYNDTCAGGWCGGFLRTCFDDEACDDNNECTTHVCNDIGECVGQNLDGMSCQDGDPFSVGDTCKNGVCIGYLPECDTDAECFDGETCTRDVCIRQLCVYEPLNNVICPDAEPNPPMGVCYNGSCVESWGECENDEDCEDGNICTVDSCIGGSCLQHNAVGTDCNDGDPSTYGDRCDDGWCGGFLRQCVVDLDCDDLDICTVEHCSEEALCAVSVSNANCNDNKFCNGDETCSDNQCVPGTPPCDEEIESCNEEDNICE